MPYSNKMFEFSTQINEVLNETETYLTRIENARRNYLSLWTHSPYLYARASIWFQKNPLNDVLISNFDSILKLKNFFFFLNWYWSPQIKFLKPNLPFFPSHFGARSYARPITDAGSPLQFYYYTSNTLIDILTRREYLYRQLFFINNKLAILPPILTNSPKNPLLTEIKSTFLFIDPFTRSNEYSRDAFYHSLNSFQINILKKKLEFFFNSFNFNRLFDHLLCYYFNNKKSGDFFQNYSPLKNQFRPLKKGISNMIRLHATGAIALPIEVRLQILASSKDVIHSWAVPSAGIKIDCVPGFSSHKVTIFLVSGIFWGQCMEICGRYHHWMPIIVYFMKRDLFFLWCTHFVFLSGSNNLWDINDRNYIDYTKPITFDKTSWITELNL
jgi:hypothetical protein